MPDNKTWSDRFQELFSKVDINRPNFTASYSEVKAFFQSELNKLGRDIIEESQNPVNLSLIGSGCESAVDIDDIKIVLAKWGVKIK